jgi:hypothetical protein
VLQKSNHFDILPEADPVIDRAHGGLRGLVGPGCPLARGTLAHEVIELNSVWTFEIPRRFGRDPEQLHAHGMARKVNVTANRVHLIAFGNRLTLPFGLHLSASPCSFLVVALVQRFT